MSDDREIVLDKYKKQIISSCCFMFKRFVSFSVIMTSHNTLLLGIQFLIRDLHIHFCPFCGAEIMVNESKYRVF